MRVGILGSGLMGGKLGTIFARANVAALSANATGIANIGTGTSVTLLELVVALERVSGR